MKIVRIVLTCMLLVSNAFVHAQTADDVVNKYIAAIGGKAIISSIKSQVIEAELFVMGSTMPSTITLLVGKGLKTKSTFNGEEIVECITPTGGWMINPLQGTTDAQPLPEEQVKARQSALDLGEELFNYKEKGSKIELAGNEMVDGVNTVKIKLTNKEGWEALYYFEITTNYLVKQEKKGYINRMEITTVYAYSNFKNTAIGYIIPYTTVTNAGFEITMNVNKVEFNKEIDPKIFEMPK